MGAECELLTWGASQVFLLCRFAQLGAPAVEAKETVSWNPCVVYVCTCLYVCDEWDGAYQQDRKVSTTSRTAPVH